VVCKVAAGTDVDYCVKEQAEYHLGGREPNGHWYTPDEQFGLANGADIDNRTFRALHAGEDPQTGEIIGKPNAQGERTHGYDCQFGAPKSVSILWALADPDTRAKIEAIQERAVRAALDYAQQAGAQIRTGHNGVNLEKTKIFGATFQHGESRPTEREDGTFRSDPQLHTHCIIFNLGQGEDGKWRALDGRALLGIQKAMGAQYHAELAKGLEQELGAVVERHDVPERRHNGEFEVRGISPDLIEQFSTRSQQIVEAMAEHGLATRESAALAAEIALATRKGKSSETREAQQARWSQEAAEAGHTWDSIRAHALGQQLDQAEVAQRQDAYEEALAAVAERLTENESVFRQADLHAALAAAGAGRGQGAVDLAKLEGDLLRQGQIVALAMDEKGAPIYSTRDMIRTEREVRQWAADEAALDSPRHIIQADKVEALLAQREAEGMPRTSEQCAALRFACARGGSHVMVEGAAGSGKTVTVLQDIADLAHRDGYKVFATAQRWQTSLELAGLKTPDGKNLDGRAAAKWIADHRAGKAGFDEKTVLLVDEAGQMGVRDVHALMQIAKETGCRIVWTGDQLQQLSAAAGNPMKILAQELGTFRLELSQRMKATAADVLEWRDGLDRGEAHRQALAMSEADRAQLVAAHGAEAEAAGVVWAREAADAFANGRAAEALQAFAEHDQLTWSDTHDQSLDAAVRDWAAYKLASPDHTALVTAARHVDVRALNGRMREILRADAKLGQDVAIVQAVDASGNKFDLALAVGEQVRLGANLKELKAYNGMVGIVTEIRGGSKPGHPMLTIDLHTPQGVRQIEIETQRLVDNAGRVRLSHAYASNNAQIQGATVHADFAQVSSRDRSNNIYVAASRARLVTQLYACRDTENIALKSRLPLAERPGATFSDEERGQHLAEALSRGQSKTSTLDYQQAATPAAAVLGAARELAAERNAGEESHMENQLHDRLMAELERVEHPVERFLIAEDFANMPMSGAEAAVAIEEARGISTQLSAEIAMSAELMRDAEEMEAAAHVMDVYQERGKAAMEERIRSREQLREQQREQARMQAQGTAEAVAPASRPTAEQASTPAERLERYFGQEFRPELVKDVERVEIKGEEITVDFTDKSWLAQDQSGEIVHHGRLSPQHAELMAEMMKAEGHDRVQLTGSMRDKEMMARACVQQGLGVENRELQQFVAQVQREQQMQARMQAAAEQQPTMQPVQQRELSRDASQEVQRQLERQQVQRDLQAEYDPVMRFIHAERLAELSDTKADRVAAEEAAVAAAVEIVQTEHIDWQGSAIEAGIMDRVDEVYAGHMSEQADAQESEHSADQSTSSDEEEDGDEE
jgi:conjugative relaxase-like TrwC/TraI family protein